MNESEKPQGVASGDPVVRRKKAVSEPNLAVNDVAFGSETGAGSVASEGTCGNIQARWDYNQASTEEPLKVEAQITCSIEAAARLYAEGYRAETHCAGLLAFCRSTGLPSFGTVEQMQNTLRAYGYNIRTLR